MRDVRIVDGAVVTADGYGPDASVREAAARYLANAFHPLQCRANRYVVSGGLTDSSLCDCGLTAARSLLGVRASLPDATGGETT